MTVQELLCSIAWEDVEAALARLYPDEVEALPAFRKAFEFVRGCEPKPNPEGWSIEIDLWRDDEGRDIWDVRARRPGDDGVYGMDYTLLDEWAGHFIAESVLAAFPPAEAAAHILWEMTWYGYSNEEILARRRELEERIAEYERNPERAVPGEEVFRKFGFEGEESP